MDWQEIFIFCCPGSIFQVVGEWLENQILIPDWTYFHCPGTSLAIPGQKLNYGPKFLPPYPELGWCQEREKIDWQEVCKFDCWLVRTIFIFCCP